MEVSREERTLEEIQATGLNYLEFLAQMHQKIAPKWYLEIGTQNGFSLLPANCNCISVDPEYTLKQDIVGRKSSVMLFQETSNNFFKRGVLDALEITIDLAFLDGMHLYEYLVRDFINVERYMSPGGVIVMHDCLPYEASMAERDRTQAKTRAWTGDVWKIIPILQEYRPDLKVAIYDAAPTGIVVVDKLDPTNTTLKDNYQEVVQKYSGLNEVERYVPTFPICSTAVSPWRSERSDSSLHLSSVLKFKASSEAIEASLVECRKDLEKSKYELRDLRKKINDLKAVLGDIGKKTFMVNEDLFPELDRVNTLINECSRKPFKAFGRRIVSKYLYSLSKKEKLFSSRRRERFLRSAQKRGQSINELDVSKGMILDIFDPLRKLPNYGLSLGMIDFQHQNNQIKEKTTDESKAPWLDASWYALRHNLDGPQMSYDHFVNVGLTHCYAPAPSFIGVDGYTMPHWAIECLFRAGAELGSSESGPLDESHSRLLTGR